MQRENETTAVQKRSYNLLLKITFNCCLFDMFGPSVKHTFF